MVPRAQVYRPNHLHPLAMHGVDTIITEQQVETGGVKIAFLVDQKRMWIPMSRTIEGPANASEGDMMIVQVLMLITVTGWSHIKQIGKTTIGITHQETEAGVQV